MRDLASLLDVEYSRLVFHLYKVPPTARYLTFEIPKRRGGTRPIAAPATSLKILQRKLAQVLSAVYAPKPPVHGFTQARNVVTNAAPHSGKRFVLNIDLEAFFQSLNFGRVRGTFRARPYSLPDPVATALAQLCCYQDGLPQGAPTSPIVSNIVCRPLDNALSQLARKYRCTYTRYADDITFSTRARQFPSQLAVATRRNVVQLGPELLLVITNAGFRVNLAKTTLADRSTRQDVTGLVVNNKPNVRRRFIRQIRAMLHAWIKYGPDAAQSEYATRYSRRYRNPTRPAPNFRRVLRGKIEYVRMVRGSTDPLYACLAQAYARCDPTYRPPRALVTANNLALTLEGALWIIESETDAIQGTGFFLADVGLVTCDHVLGRDPRAFLPSDPARSYAIEVLSRDKVLDIAVLRIVGGPITPKTLRRAASTKLDLLDELYVAGFPNYARGDTFRLSKGTVAAFRRSGPASRILVNAPIIRGMSGGPAVNRSGEVIGIAVTGADRMEDADATEKHGLIPIEALDQLPLRSQS